MVVFERFKSRPISDFHDELRFEFPNLPSQLFDYYLVKSAITMAKTGNLIRRRAIIHAESGVTRYRLESPDGMDICGIMGIHHMPDCGCHRTEVTRTFAPPVGAMSCKRDVAWYDDTEDVLYVEPSFCYGKLYVELSVSPSAGACELPEAYFTEHLDTLIMGTKGAIMLITGRPWTNLRVGQAYQNEFLQRITQENVRVMTHKQRGSVKMTFGRVM